MSLQKILSIYVIDLFIADIQPLCCESIDLLPYFPESCLRKGCSAASFEFRRENTQMIFFIRQKSMMSGMAVEDITV